MRAFRFRRQVLLPSAALSPSVAFISTFPPARCGIGTYTAALAPAVSRALGSRVRVLCERGGGPLADEHVETDACFDRTDYVDSIIEAVRRHRPDVVHIQHAVEILGVGEAILSLLSNLRKMGVRSVITLHTVHTPLSGALERHPGISRFHDALARGVDKIVVHDRATAEGVLGRQGVPLSKVAVIDHGTRLFEAADRQACRDRLGLGAGAPGAPLFLYFGFIHPQKGLLTAIRAFARVVKRHPESRLLVAGSIQNDYWLNRAYLRTCQSYVRRRGLTEQVVWRLGFVPDEDVARYYGAADVVLLPYVQLYGSASGVVHLAMGAHRAILCSSSPKFREIAEHIGPDAVAPMLSARGWSELMNRAIEDPTWLASLAERARSHAIRTSWEAVGARHVRLYESLVDAATPDS